MREEDIVIRRIKEYELDQMIELCEEHAKFEKTEYSREGKLKKLHAHLWGNELVLICFVAVSKKELLGYITYTREFSTWSADYFFHMDCLYIKEKKRKLGIGRRLVNEMVKSADREGIKQIQWQTPIENLNAIEFYHHLGAYSKEKSRFYLNL